MDFTHLHVHTQHSILDGAIRIDQLCKYISEQGMSSIAITDHGSISGVINFYKECKKYNVRPLIGVEAYCTEDPDNIPKETRTRDNYHMILLAINNVGYKNLIWLMSNAAINNFYYKPRIYIKHLANKSEGIVATTGCLAGHLARVMEGTAPSLGKDHGLSEQECIGIASNHLARYAEIFKDRFYLELQDHRTHTDTFQERHNNRLLKLSKDLGLPTVITSDAHYLKKEDSSIHDILMCVQLKQTLAEYHQGEYFNYLGAYVRPQEEMHEAAIAIGDEQAFFNTIKIGNMSDISFKFGEYQMPTFDIDQVEDKQEFKEWLANGQPC